MWCKTLFTLYTKPSRLDYQPLFGKGARTPAPRHERAAEVEPTNLVPFESTQLLSPFRSDPLFHLELVSMQAPPTLGLSSCLSLNLIQLVLSVEERQGSDSVSQTPGDIGDLKDPKCKLQGQLTCWTKMSVARVGGGGEWGLPY